MNLAIRGIDGQIGHGDSFHNDRHPDLKADFILASPPSTLARLVQRQVAVERRVNGVQYLTDGAPRRVAEGAEPHEVRGSLAEHVAPTRSC